ncbi:hypothetical protein [Streptomyces profundus]|uniref:hypothetical protein n=1 Tax=Streptomyces profundus TaxID=2867410 RepID=UPI001D16E677|nr:hypothetical protein [Streptomyces sp. MA3_2.13]UED86597.1 hypothetical protein K4G22_22360 [Streptomyces sp. MA3_2.13]
MAKEYNLKLARVSAPYASLPNGTIEGVSVPLVRHHVIPCQRLVNFWNQLILNGTHFALVKDFAAKIKANFKNYGTNIDSRDHENLENLLTDLHNCRHKESATTRPGEDGAWDTFVQLYCWLPGNLFGGPKEEHRSDDPKENFELTSAPIIGQPAFDNLRNLDAAMSGYINTPANSPKDVLTSFKDNIAAKTAIVAFQADRWEKKVIDGKNKFAIRPPTRLIEPQPPCERKIRIRGYVDLEIDF